MFRFLHYALPKKIETTINISHSIEYESEEDTNEDEENISDSEYEIETSNEIDHNLPSISQVLIVAKLIGKREFVLSRNGTKKFLNKVKQYQELSHVNKSNDVNYGSRIGKAAEILCKFAAISEIIRISMDVLQ